MASEDITFCMNSKCTNRKCERNPKNIKLHWLDHSYAMFPDCKNFKDEEEREE